MKKAFFLFAILLAVSAYAVNMTWTPGGANNNYTRGEADGNWNIARAPLSTDTVIFNGATSNGLCSLNTSNIFAYRLRVRANYTGAHRWTNNTKLNVTTGHYRDSGSGNRNYIGNDTLNLLGDGTVALLASIGTLTNPQNWRIIWGGIDTLLDHNTYTMGP